MNMDFLKYNISRLIAIYCSPRPWSGQFVLLVQLYRGLKQYRETEDILRILYKHDHFELFLGQKSAEEDYGASGAELKLVCVCVCVFMYV